MTSKGYGALGDGPPLGSHWQEIDAEGRSYQLHGKLPTALKTLNKAAACPGGCGWSVFAHRAECHLQLLESAAALQDVSQAMDMQRSGGGPGASPIGVLQTACDALWREAELEEALVVVARLCARKKGRRLAGDEHAQRMEGIRGDIGRALGPSVGRVLRRDLLRAMMVKKGIDPNNPMAGPRHSWVGPGYGVTEPIWRIGGPDPGTSAKVPLPLPLSWGAAQWRKDQRDPERHEDGVQEQQEDPRRWGWMRQIPGHDHVCADPLIAEQADRIAELRELGQLERDRAYLLYLLGQLKVDMVESGCAPCPGPNLEKWRDEQLRADANDTYCDPLALSKWEAQDACKKSLEDLKNYVASRLRIKGRYQHAAAGRVPRPSPKMRASRAESRRERAFSTVRFMMRRVHECLRLELYRDADSVGERLVAFLERLPCRVFPDRLNALARTLDCRAVAARRRNNTQLAVEMQKRRCQVAVDHGLPELYARALDELALLLFSMADYQQAEASWTERAGLRAENLREKAQAVFQLARCCFVQGYLRMLGKVEASMGRGEAPGASVRKDHRQDLPEYSLLGSLSGREDSKSLKSRSATVGSEAGDLDLNRWRSSPEDGDEWSPEMYCGGPCDSDENEEEEKEKGSEGESEGDGDGEGEREEQGEAEGEEAEKAPELKPTCVEACLRIIMQDLNTQDPLHDCGDLLCMERFPDPEDARRSYPLMPPDFNPAHNIMNEEFELFEKRFREACQYFVGEVTGKPVHPSSEEAPRRQPERSREGTLEGSLDHIPEASEAEAEAEADAEAEAEGEGEEEGEARPPPPQDDNQTNSK